MCVRVRVCIVIVSGGAFIVLCKYSVLNSVLIFIIVNLFCTFLNYNLPTNSLVHKQL